MEFYQKQIPVLMDVRLKRKFMQLKNALHVLESLAATVPRRKRETTYFLFYSLSTCMVFTQHKLLLLMVLNMTMFEKKSF